MIGRQLRRAISRFLGAVLAYLVAAAMFNDQTYALIAMASYLFGNWFNAVMVLVVISATRIISHNLTYSYVAGLIYEIGARVYVTSTRLRNGVL